MSKTYKHPRTKRKNSIKAMKLKKIDRKDKKSLDILQNSDLGVIS